MDTAVVSVPLTRKIRRSKDSFFSHFASSPKDLLKCLKDCRFLRGINYYFNILN